MTWATRDPWAPTARSRGPRVRALAEQAGNYGISPTFIGDYFGIPIVRTKAQPVGRITMYAERVTPPPGPLPEVNLFDPDVYAAIEREEVPVWRALGRRDLPYERRLFVGDADRFADPYVETVYRLAIADAVETVRAGLAHLVPRDRTAEALADLYRPTPGGPA